MSQSGKDAPSRSGDQSIHNFIIELQGRKSGQRVAVSYDGEAGPQENLSATGSANETNQLLRPVMWRIGGGAEKHVRVLERHRDGLVAPGPSGVGQYEAQTGKIQRRAIDPDWGVNQVLREATEAINRDEIDARRQLELG